MLILSKTSHFAGHFMLNYYLSDQTCDFHRKHIKMGKQVSVSLVCTKINQNIFL